MHLHAVLAALLMASPALSGQVLPSVPGRADLQAVGPPPSSRGSPVQTAVKRSPAWSPVPLSCKLRTSKPRLDLEFRLYTSFRIAIPVKQLRGPATTWRVTMDVEPLSPEGGLPIHASDVVQSGPIPPHAKGTVEMGASLALGEGTYGIKWSMVDSLGRHCEVSWTVRAKLSRRDRKVALRLEPGEVRRGRLYMFRGEDPVRGSDSEPRLRLKVFLSFDTASRRRATIGSWQIGPILSMLRVLYRHRHVSELAIVAYSLDDQKVLCRQDFHELIQFQLLREGVGELSPGMVDVNELSRDADVRFLAAMLHQEMNTGLHQEMNAGMEADAFIFIGRDVLFSRKIPPRLFEGLEQNDVPVFFLNYAVSPWRGIVGNTVKRLQGKEYKIRRPRELSKAVDRLVHEILKPRFPLDSDIPAFGRP